MLDRTRDRLPAGRFGPTLPRGIDKGKHMRHVIAVLLENEAGALSRVANLFSARGYNIEALSVAPTDDETVSRMTIVTQGTDEIIEQITKQLNKLIDVIRVIDLTESAHIEREMMLVKVAVPREENGRLGQLVEIFRGHVIDVAGDTYTIELTGTGTKLDAFVDNLQGYDLIEVVRSGPLAIARGGRALRV
ncbi:MAG: acetolactate synthase small subunit [Gammaproteobacteria bacterium]|nr:MAG: acetolactate synthase small subunit [Gammaproteobacteria bacterium]